MRATGMPLGLLPGMGYEEKEITLAPGDTVFFYSDGLAEAHSPVGEMYGFPRVQALLTGCHSQDDLIACSLDSLANFTGAGWEQEDDVTLVSCTVQVSSNDFSRSPPASGAPWPSFEIASQPGNERQAAEQVAAAVAEILPLARLERLKTAVAEATMNAMEHGNQYQPDVPVQIWVDESPAAVRVCIVDQGGGQRFSVGDAEAPDLEAKLSGLQSPRGWGLFLIQAMVDEMNVSSDDRHHTVELVMNRAEDGPDAAQGA
jgi:anti-sigma regulatory factor (Ser/Thr protein kinase)